MSRPDQRHRLARLWSDHHFDHHLGLSTEIRLCAKSLSLRKIGRLGTSLDTLPMPGVKRVRRASRPPSRKWLRTQGRTASGRAAP